MKNKKAYIITSLKTFGWFCLAYILYRIMFAPTPPHNFNTNNPDNYINLQLIKVADSVNKIAHNYDDSMTEFVSAESLPNKIFQYNYALKIDTNKYDIRKIKEVNEKQIFDSIIMAPALKELRDYNVTIIYNFIDVNKNPLYKIVFTPDTYKR